MALYTDKFIVDGIQHEGLPSEWKHVEEDFGIRRHSYLTLDSNRIVINFQPAETLDQYIEYRRIHRQAWQGAWSNDSFMTEEMYDHLRTLYTLQQPFWLQFDSEMSRDGAVLVQTGENYNAYFTPTYPIAPFGYEPGGPQEYNGTISVNGQAIYSGFNVDSELGIVKFDVAKVVTDKVHMAYTWKAFVVISSMNVQPVDVAGGIYEGTVTFEQIRPDYTKDPWNVRFVTNVAIGDDTLGGGPTDPSAPTSYVTIPWYDTRFASYGPGRLFVFWWLIRWKRF